MIALHYIYTIYDSIAFNIYTIYDSIAFDIYILFMIVLHLIYNKMFHYFLYKIQYSIETIMVIWLLD